MTTRGITIHAIRNKKTGRLLVVEPEAEKRQDYGEDYVYVVKWLVLRDSVYPGVIFVTTDADLSADLVKEGKSGGGCSEVRIDFGWDRPLFTPADLEAVELIAP